MSQALPPKQDMAGSKPVVSPFAVFKRLLPGLLVGLFIILALAADLAPAKKFYFTTERNLLETFFHLEDPDFRLPLQVCGVDDQHVSLPYLLLLKGVHALVPDRLFSMRLVSVSAAVGILVCLYLIGASLWSRRVAVIALFFLVTNPAFLETARAFGYLSLSHLAALLAILLTVISHRRRRWWPWVSLSALTSYLLLYLYSPIRLEAIPLILVWFLIGGDNRWKKVFLFCVVFAGLFAAISAFQRTGETSAILTAFQFQHVGEHAGGEAALVSFARLTRNTSRNAAVLLGYLLNLRRTAFSTGAVTSRLFHSAYIPFWIIGLAVTVIRRRPGNIMVLLMLFFFVLVKLPIADLLPRRLMTIQYPIAFLVGLGMEGVYSSLSRALADRPLRRGIPAAFGVFFIAIGTIETRHFLELSRPQYSVSSEQLSAISDLVLERAEENHRIIFPGKEHPYLLGNRFLVNRLAENHRIGGALFLGYLREALVFHDSFTAVFHRSSSSDYPPGADWALERFPETVSISRIPKTDFKALTFLPPPSVSPNLIAWKKPRVLLSGGPNLEPRPFADDPFFDLEIRPARKGEAPWVIFDFGPDNRRIPRFLAAEPHYDGISARPDLFIREAIISAGTDGEDWEKLGRIRGDKVTRRPFLLYQWNLPGDRPYRYYRLEFFEVNGQPAEAVSLLNFGLFETGKHADGVFEPDRIVPDGGLEYP